MNVGRPIRHCCIGQEVGNGRRDRKKQQFQEIFKRLKQPNLLTYLAFYCIRKRKTSCKTINYGAIH